MAGTVFDALADDYDAARPSYPDCLFDDLESTAGPLAGQLVLDGGAGTGIATRQLAARGARTVALDLGERMLRHAAARSPSSCCLLADGHAMPLRDGSMDLACFAQSWHWFDPGQAGAEVGRVLRRGGFWAAWWNQAWADDEDWFRMRREVLEAACPDYSAQPYYRNVDWSNQELDRTGLFEAGQVVIVPWTRTVSTADWLTQERSHSYVGVLPPGDRERLLARVARIIGDAFPGGVMPVPYRTRMWLARRR